MAWKPQPHRTRQPQTGNRPSPAARGYDRQWLAFSWRYRQEHPLCADCEKVGIVKPSQEVHHVHKLATHPELKYELDNLMAMCKGCHAARTARGE